MSIEAVLFDLDGTLLPMDQEEFTKAYFSGLTKKLAPLGYEPEALIKAIWQSTYAMIKNDGNSTNEKVFWNAFTKIFGEKVMEDVPVFDEFYRKEFSFVKEVCGFNSKSAEIVNALKNNNICVVLATNPIFPKIATESRIKWAGLTHSDFALYTTYENSCYCKPNPKYYLEICEKINVLPENCLMVGNDVKEDMVAETIGMKTFLLTDNLINKDNADISDFSQGDFNTLISFLKSEKVLE